MSIWDKHPNYSPDELRMLVQVTAEVLLDSATDAHTLPPDLLQISSLAASKEIASQLQDTIPRVRREQVQEFLNHEEAAESLCLKILDEIRKYPELADRIGAAYEKESRKMLGILELLAGALIVLVIKLKSVDLVDEATKPGSRKRRTTIKFSEASTAVKSFFAHWFAGGN
jgi:hypothetical protein